GEGGGAANFRLGVPELVAERGRSHARQPLGEGVAGLGFGGAVQSADDRGQGIRVCRPLALLELVQQLLLLPAGRLGQRRGQARGFRLGRLGSDRLGGGRL